MLPVNAKTVSILTDGTLHPTFGHFFESVFRNRSLEVIDFSNFAKPEAEIAQSLSGKSVWICDVKDPTGEQKEKLKVLTANCKRVAIWRFRENDPVANSFENEAPLHLKNEARKVWKEITPSDKTAYYGMNKQVLLPEVRLKEIREIFDCVIPISATDGPDQQLLDIRRGVSSTKEPSLLSSVEQQLIPAAVEEPVPASFTTSAQPPAPSPVPLAETTQALQEALRPAAVAEVDLMSFLTSAPQAPAPAPKQESKPDPVAVTATPPASNEVLVSSLKPAAPTPAQEAKRHPAWYSRVEFEPSKPALVSTATPTPANDLAAPLPKQTTLKSANSAPLPAIPNPVSPAVMQKELDALHKVLDPVFVPATKKTFSWKWIVGGLGFVAFLTAVFARKQFTQIWNSISLK